MLIWKLKADKSHTVSRCVSCKNLPVQEAREHRFSPWVRKMHIRVAYSNLAPEEHGQEEPGALYSQGSKIRTATEHTHNFLLHLKWIPSRISITQGICSIFHVAILNEKFEKRIYYMCMYN